MHHKLASASAWRLRTQMRSKPFEVGGSIPGGLLSFYGLKVHLQAFPPEE